MEKMPQIPDEKSFYRLPFEKGTLELTEETLKKHSTHLLSQSHSGISLRNISYQNEILTLGVKLKDEVEQRVFLKVKQGELLVSCSAGTNSDYLGKHAFLALSNQMGYGGIAGFEKYYWPDFFNPSTGRSKYLQIINDRRGFDIELKPKYPTFFKPGDKLLPISIEKSIVRDSPQKVILEEDPPTTSYTIGYFLASFLRSSIRSDHFPFLIPFLGTLTKDKNGIKSYTSFLFNERDTQLLVFSSKKEQLNEVCFKMRELAPIRSRYFSEPSSLNEDEIKRGRELFELWHQYKESILSERIVYYYGSYGLRFLSGKPRRSWVDTTLRIKKEVPQLLFEKKDKGEYFILELRFRVGKKALSPYNRNVPFFISDRNNSEGLYLLNDFTDFLLVDFFQKKKFKLAILKPHYKDEIMEFVNQLAERYELIES